MHPTIHSFRVSYFYVPLTIPQVGGKCNQRAESYLRTERHQSLTDENGGVRVGCVGGAQRQQWDRTALWSEAFEKRCLRLISRKQVWELQKAKEGFPGLWIYHSPSKNQRDKSRFKEGYYDAEQNVSPQMIRQHLLRQEAGQNNHGRTVGGNRK